MKGGRVGRDVQMLSEALAMAPLGAFWRSCFGMAGLIVTLKPTKSYYCSFAVARCRSLSVCSIQNFVLFSGYLSISPTDVRPWQAHDRVTGKKAESWSQHDYQRRHVRESTVHVQ